MARPKKEEVIDASEIVSEKENKKQMALDLAIASIEKQFGMGSIMTLDGYKDQSPVKHISSGSKALDIILGRGGFVFGRVVEMYGANGCGKTTLCLTIIALAQKLGMKCAIIDKENALDVDYAQTLGVDISKLYISQPGTGEEALSITEKLIGSGAMDIIVIDSIAAINPSADLDKDLSGNAKMAGRASLLTRFFERNDSAINKNGVLLLCINQLRENLNPYSSGPSVPGGMAIKHAASYRLEMSVVNKDKVMGEDGSQIGNRVRIKTTKNKLNSPFKEASYDLIFGVGIDRIKDMLEVAVGAGVIEKAGSWYIYGDHRFQGINGAREFFNTEELIKTLETQINEKLGLNPGPQGK